MGGTTMKDNEELYYNVAGDSYYIFPRKLFISKIL